MIGWRVYDVMRAIDWIGTRKELDAAHVGCMGISGGGTCTLFAAALDSRIRAAMVSGYLNTFRECIMSVSHCIDNYVPGILNWAEQYDVAGLIAPRPLFAESGEREIFSRWRRRARVSGGCRRCMRCSTRAALPNMRLSTVRTVSGETGAAFHGSPSRGKLNAGILNWAEQYDVAGLIAPRPLFAESGEARQYFPGGGGTRGFRRVQKVYALFDAGSATEHETFDGPHSFWGKLRAAFHGSPSRGKLNIWPF